LIEASGVSNPFGYASGYTDSATGLVKFGTRYYSPAIGLFSQEDPSGQTTGYTYAGDSPVNGTDPTGMNSVYAGCAEAAGITAEFAGAAAATGAGLELSIVDLLGSCLVGSIASLVGGLFGQILSGGSTENDLIKAYAFITGL
jgi:RHS repeat-associated protein